MLHNLNSIDLTIIVIYFCILVGLGLYLRKRASASLEDYFLAGRSMPWWALGVSGMASWLDLTGTMIVTSFLFLLGPRGLFIEFRGGAVLIAAVGLLWVGKWHRRSQCITGAEWMIFRFGDGFGGQFARLASSAAVIMSSIGMLAYMIVGVGLFLSMFLPFSPFYCALVMISIAALYTMASGFYGVVFTDLFQSGIVVIAVVIICLMAFARVESSESLALLASQVTGNSQWISSSPHWTTEMPASHEAYRHLFIFAMFYLIRNVLGGMGSGAEPKYFGAKNDRECGTLTFVTIFCIMFRWPMMLAFAILGLFLVQDLFPDQANLLDSAELIRQTVGNATEAGWPTLISNIVHYPEMYSSEMIEGLRTSLGDDWNSKLYLLSYEGTVSAERILPSVLLNTIPMGLRGLILCALIAASMSTFDTTANIAASFFTRDIYQRYLRPKAANSELIYASWVFIASIVVVAFIFAFTIKSINDIWGWIIMGLGTGLMVPGILRLYWWRFNGEGFAWGTVIGMLAAIVQRLLWPETDERLQFGIMATVGLFGSIVGTYLSKPTDPAVLMNFYRITRPFGFWSGLLNSFSSEERAMIKKEHRNDILALPFTLGWQITLFLLPMQLLIKSYDAFYITLAIFLVCLGGMYIFWYRNLPAENYPVPERLMAPVKLPKEQVEVAAYGLSGLSDTARTAKDTVADEEA